MTGDTCLVPSGPPADLHDMLSSLQKFGWKKSAIDGALYRLVGTGGYESIRSEGMGHPGKVLYRGSGDGVAPPPFGQIDRKTGTPAEVLDYLLSKYTVEAAR